MRPAACLACAVLSLCAPASAGEARREVAPLLDRVLSDPGDKAARAGLREAAVRAEAERRAEAEAERASLRTGAAKDKENLDRLKALKAARMREWEKEFARVCALASSGGTAGQAVADYERLMDAAPVYSDNRERLREAGEKLKGIFYVTIRREFPYLVQGRTWTDERDIAALTFTRASVRDEDTRYLDTGVTQQILDMAARLRRRETELGRQYENLKEGRELYAKRRYREALEFFDKVLAFDSGNEEAQFFRVRTAEGAGLKD